MWHSNLSLHDLVFEVSEPFGMNPVRINPVQTQEAVFNCWSGVALPRSKKICTKGKSWFEEKDLPFENIHFMITNFPT